MPRSETGLNTFGLDDQDQGMTDSPVLRGGRLAHTTALTLDIETLHRSNEEYHLVVRGEAGYGATLQAFHDACRDNDVETEEYQGRPPDGLAESSAVVVDEADPMLTGRWMPDDDRPTTDALPRPAGARTVKAVTDPLLRSKIAIQAASAGREATRRKVGTEP